MQSNKSAPIRWRHTPKPLAITRLRCEGYTWSKPLLWQGWFYPKFREIGFQNVVISRLLRASEPQVTGVEIPCYDWGVFAVILYFDSSDTKAFACVWTTGYSILVNPCSTTVLTVFAKLREQALRSLAPQWVWNRKITRNWFFRLSHTSGFSRLRSGGKTCLNPLL